MDAPSEPDVDKMSSMDDPRRAPAAHPVEGHELAAVILLALVAVLTRQQRTRHRW